MKENVKLCSLDNLWTRKVNFGSCAKAPAGQGTVRVWREGTSNIVLALAQYGRATCHISNTTYIAMVGSAI